MQGIAKHRYAASAFHEGVCRVSVRLSASMCEELHRAASQRKPQHRSDVKSNAATVWRRAVAEGLWLLKAGHCTAVRCTALQGKAKKRGQPFTEGCPRFFESQRSASHRTERHCSARQRTAAHRKATKRGQHLESGCCPSRVDSNHHQPSSQSRGLFY